jgi:hypothetical protein
MQATCAVIQCHSGAPVLLVMFVIFVVLLVVDRMSEQ